MSSYKFRIRFHLISKGALQGDGNSLGAVQADGVEIALQTNGSEKPISETNRLILTGGPYNTESAAREAGVCAKDALFLACASMRIGIDCGNDKAKFWLHPDVINMTWEVGEIRSLEDIHGLMVYDSSERVSFRHGSPCTAVVTNDGQGFLAEMTRLLSLGVKPSEKQRLALELLGFARFETSERARFLTCMLAYEALLDRENRGSEALDVLENLARVVDQSDLGEKDKNSLKGGLSSLKNQSIGRTGKALAHKYLGDREYDGLSADKFFYKCYEIRSKLVHTGHAGECGTALGSRAAQLEVMLSDLLTTMLIPRAEHTEEG